MHKGYQVLLLLLFLGFCSVLAKYWPTSSEQWASWVQAIGSIAAIVAAVVIAQTQQRQMRLLESEKYLDRVRTALHLVEHCHGLVVRLEKESSIAVELSAFRQVEAAMLGFSLNGMSGDLVLKILEATQLATSARQVAERCEDEYETYGGPSPNTDDWLESLINRLSQSIVGLRQSLQLARSNC